MEYEPEFKREDNQEYFNLQDGQKALMRRIKECDDELLNLKIPTWWLCGTKRKIESIQRKIMKIQKDFLGWREQAGKFCDNPHYKVETLPGDYTRIYLRLTMAMRDVINQCDSNRVLLVGNVNGKESDYRHQSNFLMAIIGLTAAFTGLIVAVYSLYLVL